MKFKEIFKTTVPPLNSELQEYSSTLIGTRHLFKVTFNYVLNGERVQRSFYLARCVPWCVSKELIGINKRRFERKILYYKHLMEG